MQWERALYADSLIHKRKQPEQNETSGLLLSILHAVASCVVIDKVPSETEAESVVERAVRSMRMSHVCHLRTICCMVEVSV
jgi:hypothetical protein